MNTKLCNTCNRDLVYASFPCRKDTLKPVGGKCKECYANHALLKKGIQRTYPYRAELSEAKKIEIITGFTSGSSYTKLSKQHVVNRETIRQILRRANIPLLSQEETQERIQTGIKLQLEQLNEATGTTHLERLKARNQRRRKRVTDAILEILNEKSCVDCGEANLLVLQFDHRDPKEKKRDISKCSTATSLKSEIQKCDIVCANCHAIRTQKMFGSWRLKFTP